MKIFSMSSARLRRGFTLIELLIVIVIIGILAVGLVPKVIDAPKRARDVVRKADLNNIKVAIQSYYGDKSDYPADLNALASYYADKVAIAKDTQGNAYTYKVGTNKACYILGTKLETAGGNSDTDLSAGIDCNTTLPVANNNAKMYFYVISG